MRKSSGHNTPPAPANSRDGIPAATIIIFRDCPEGGAPQVLLTVRSRNMAFAGGMAVFPGGRVDPADRELATQVASEAGLAADEAAHQIAAIRETLEETGLVLGLAGQIDARRAVKARAMLEREKALAPVLEAFGWTLDFAQIVPFARWFPKGENLARIYDTRFYLANLGTGAVEVSVDNNEATRLFWTSAQAALDLADAGEIKVIFPTRRNLERLAQFANFSEAEAQAETIPIKTIVPRVEKRGDQTFLTIMPDAGYPITEVVLDDTARQ